AMTANRAVTATFASYTLTVHNAGTAGGSINTADGRISCGASFAAPEVPGSVVRITAHSAGGATFSSWSGACSGTLSYCDVTMSAAKSATANYVPCVPSCSSSRCGVGDGCGGCCGTGGCGIGLVCDTGIGLCGGCSAP